MKQRLLILALLLLAPYFTQGQEIGAFFTKVNAYIYTAGPQAGKRFLVRPRQALSVLNVRADAEDKLWLYVIDPKRSVKQTGEGWTPLTTSELLGSGGKPVEVFSEVFDNGGTASVATKVPASDVELLNLTKSSKRLPQVVWQKVRYATKTPLRAWIQASAGVFRPGKDSEFMSRVYVELVSRNLKKEKLDRLMSGVVRVGDSAWEVERALGKPQGKQEASKGRVTWQYPSLTIRFADDVVNQIN